MRLICGSLLQTSSFQVDDSVVWRTSKAANLLAPRSLKELLILLDRPLFAVEEVEEEQQRPFVPAHLVQVMWTVEEAEAVLTGLHSVECVARRYRPVQK